MSGESGVRIYSLHDSKGYKELKKKSNPLLDRIERDFDFENGIFGGI